MFRKRMCISDTCHHLQLVSGELVLMTPRRGGDDPGLAANPSSVLIADYFEAGVPQPLIPQPTPFSPQPSPLIPHPSSLTPQRERRGPYVSHQPDAVMGELVLMTPRREAASRLAGNQSSVFVADYFEPDTAEWERSDPFAAQQSEEKSELGNIVAI